MYASNYFRATYFRAIWPAGAIGPKVVALVVEAIWGSEAAVRFLTLSRLPAETIQAGEGFRRLLQLARLITAVVQPFEDMLPSRAIIRLEDSAISISEQIIKLTEMIGAIIRRTAETLLLNELVDWAHQPIVRWFIERIRLKETRPRLRGMVRSKTSTVRLAEGTWKLIRRVAEVAAGLVHGGVRVGAAIVARLMFNRDRRS